MEIGIPVIGLEPELEENESVAFKEVETHLHINELDLGNGTLILGTKRLGLILLNSFDVGNGTLIKSLEYSIRSIIENDKYSVDTSELDT